MTETMTYDLAWKSTIAERYNSEMNVYAEALAKGSGLAVKDVYGGGAPGIGMDPEALIADNGVIVETTDFEAVKALARSLAKVVRHSVIVSAGPAWEPIYLATPTQNEG